MPADTVQLKNEYEQLKTARASVEGTWNQIEKFVGPFGSGRQVQPGPSSDSVIDWQRLDVYDFTAINGSEKLAASIHGSVTSPAIRWYRLTFGDKHLTDDSDAAEKLDTNSDRSFDALQDSDFNTEVASSYLDLVRYGNAFIVCEAASETEWDGLDFTAIPLRDGYPVEGGKGRLKKFFRRLDWTPVRIVDEFGEENVPKDVRERAKTPEGMTETMEVVWCVFEREDVRRRLKVARKLRKADGPLVLRPEKRSVGSVYFLAEAGEQLGEEGGYYEMPVFHVRWQKTAGTIWGHGPGHLALPTVKLLNAYCEADLVAADKVIDPPWAVTERGLLSSLQLKRGGVTVVRSKEDIWPLESASRFDVSDKKMSELRAQIRDLFHENELTLRESPAMTATEVQARYELMNRLFGPTLSRIQSDLLDPLIHLVLGILYRAGQLEKMPQQVVSSDGNLNIEYQGPLARAQRTDEVAAIERGASFVAALMKNQFTRGPKAFKDEQAVREVFKRLGTPASLLKSEKQVDDEIVAEQRAKAAVQKAEVLRAQGEAAEQAGLARQALSAPEPAQPPPVVTPTFPGA